MENDCRDEVSLMEYQHGVYSVVYSVIFAPGLIFNILALWVFRIYIKETKKAVLFMMNLAVADLLQVLSLPLRIYYYVNENWPFGEPLCMVCFYLKYVNMYASIFFLMCISIRRCQLVKCPLEYNSSKKKGDLLVCGLGWLFIALFCLAFPLVRQADSTDNKTVCFSELPIKNLTIPVTGALIVMAELGGLVIPLNVVLVCTCVTVKSLREPTAQAVPDGREKRRALRMVLSCAVVFLVCFLPYHVTLPLDLLAKYNRLGNCTLRKLIMRCHAVTLGLASLNCTLDPFMYYFTSDEFWRRLSKNESPETVSLNLLQSNSHVGELEAG